jgi:hypothetical protein
VRANRPQGCTGSREAEEHVAQTGLADAALAVQDHDPAGARADIFERFGQDGQFAIAIQEQAVRAVAGRRRIRSEAFRHEGIPEAGLAPDEMRISCIFFEDRADFVDEHLDVVRQHVDVRPHRRHDLCLGDEPAIGGHEAGQQVPGLGGHVDALGVAPQRAIGLTKMEGPEVHGLLICRRLCRGSIGPRAQRHARDVNAPNALSQSPYGKASVVVTVRPT